MGVLSEMSAVPHIDKLPADERADGFSVIEKLEQEKFEELTIKPWRGKISEVYFYKHNRMFYVIVDGEIIYVLHACRKQKNKTEQGDTEKVVNRAKKLGEELSKKFI
jgi:phage-related protein